jgi:hypothetical protein
MAALQGARDESAMVGERGAIATASDDFLVRVLFGAFGFHQLLLVLRRQHRRRD